MGTLDAQGRLEGGWVQLDATFAPAKKGQIRSGLTRKGKGAKRRLVVDDRGISLGEVRTSALQRIVFVELGTFAC